jgi:NitT/TauT family transport system substrate-binding protein
MSTTAGPRLTPAAPPSSAGTLAAGPPGNATIAFALLACAVLATGCVRGHDRPRDEVRLGYFPNLTHAQALVGLARGDFQKAVAPLRLVPRAFSAGPQAMEALFAGELDLCYVGSGPAVNAYVRSSGRALRVVAGAAGGGASLVVRTDSNIRGPADLAGRRIATPQIGNTQDIALRSYLVEHGLAPTDKGGSVQVVSSSNPDILSLMIRRQIDGAWVPEPWATRLVREAAGRVLVDERDLWPHGRFATTVVVASQTFLGQQPEVVRRFLGAHVDVTLWIRDHPAEARAQVNAELGRLLGKPLPAEVLDDAFSRLEVTYDPLEDSLLRAAERAFELGFLGSRRPDVAGLLDLGLLHDVLAERRLEPVTASGGGSHSDGRHSR